ncbi:DUF6113 family protein [Streptomyces jumonjinensis]|uniref:Integral membrane protein n=1 Tax=Streptomyces jumonjinensis TaxID=1945 RepID=A0A646KR57_STRJU|nr:DUF6113 family protein [Streptomyces jumonjinensis]MQT04517.1 hypothetical protein [Streptomyces jumonjinensis]
MNERTKEPREPGAWLTRPAKPARIAVYAVLVLLGLVVGAAGSLIQAAWFPGGLLLALLGAAGLFHGSGRLLGNQLGVLVSAAGWLVAIMLLTTGRPEGDGVFSAGIGPLVFILGGMAIAVICATMARGVQPGGPAIRLDG